VRTGKVIIALLIFSINLFAQEIGDVVQIMSAERELKVLFEDLYTVDDSPYRDSINEVIINKLSVLLITWDGFHYKWDALDNIGKVTSEDNKIRIFSWYLKNPSGKYEYFGVVALRNEGKREKKHNNEFSVFVLNDQSHKMREAASLLLSYDNWFGAVYYQIKTFRYRRNTWYALTGFDFNDDFSNKKLIEILTINKNNEPEFGGAFLNGENEIKRMIFEYSSQIAMSLGFDEKLDMFVYDHLSPFEPIFKGSYRFYGPDGSFDGIRFEKGEFIIEKDVDARNY